MHRLVAIEATVDAAFVEQLQHAWDTGDAVLPVDPRLPPAAARQLVEMLRAGAPVESGDALVVATSGTTGEPKGVVLTHDALMVSARASSDRLRVETTTDRWLARLPTAHIGGLSVITRALLSGTPLTFDDSEPATLVSLVPTQADRLGVDGLSRFRAVLIGGAADWGSRATRPANVVRTYGLTETGSGIAYDGVPLDGVEVELDAETSEVRVRGAMLLRAYRDGHSPVDGDGWLATGDGGRWDNGRLVVEGRLSEVIVTGGEKVWPAAVEAALAGAPGVAEVAISPAPDAEWGQRVVAHVVPLDASRPPTLDALRDHAAATLPRYACPRELVLVASLPRTAIGKVRRSELTG